MSIQMSKNLCLAALMAALSLTTACAPNFSSSINSSNAQNDETFQNPTNPEVTAIPTKPNLAMTSLAWESSKPESKLWSAYIYDVIAQEEPEMLNIDSALDADLFCPRYKQLTKNQRINFWGQLFVAMAKFESSWKPNSYYVELDMETDPITGKQVASEGLLQLSYQDTKSYGRFACDFDWNADKGYANDDMRKSIFNPYKNLRCGVKIMARILRRKQMISFESGVYWSVLRKSSTNVKLPKIIEITKSLPFCTAAN